MEVDLLGVHSSLVLAGPVDKASGGGMHQRAGQIIAHKFWLTFLRINAVFKYL